MFDVSLNGLRWVQVPINLYVHHVLKVPVNGLATNVAHAGSARKQLCVCNFEVHSGHRQRVY